MSIGLGILLGVVGAVLLTGAIELPNSWPINAEPLGWVLFIAGVIAIVLSLVINRQRQQHTTRVEQQRRDY